MVNPCVMTGSSSAVRPFHTSSSTQRHPARRTCLYISTEELPASWPAETQKIKKHYGGLKYKATLHIVSYSKRFFCAGWLNQKVVNKELLGSVSLWRTIIAHRMELCVFPRHLNVLSFTFSAVQISCELNEYISIDYVNNNPLTPAEYLTFLSLFPVERNADCTNLLMQSNESAAGSQRVVCVCVRIPVRYVLCDELMK